MAGNSHPPPPPLSFVAFTPELLDQEATKIKEKFLNTVKDIKQQGSANNAVSDEDGNREIGSRNNRFNSLSLALGEASAASVRITLPSMVHENAEVRAASHKAKDDFKNMFDGVLSDEALYNSLFGSDKNGGDLNIKSGECDNQNDESMINCDEDARFRWNILRILSRNGCALPCTSTRVEIREKRRHIEEVCTAFCSAINENDEFLLFSDEDLAGIPNVERFPLVEADGTKKRKLTLKSPDALPLLKFASNPTTRKRMAVALAKKCQEENTPRFLQALKLRQECAELLGYGCHAEYMCEVKMVKSPKKAEEFLMELLKGFEPIRERELNLILKLKKEDMGVADNDPHVALDPWDISYYIQIYKAKYAGVDEAELKKYFPLKHVKNTILEIYEELLGLKFEKVLGAQVWHEDVECYAVRTYQSDIPAQAGDGDGSSGRIKSNGEVIGYFYLDIHPRKGKYSHQCVYPLQPSYNINGDRVLPACVNIGNLTPSSEASPSMLMFREVETFFHEFGHVCHCILTKSKHSLHSWAWSAVPWPGGVEQDFLEVPSMMLENFVWCPEILRRLSKHETDGSCLPESTIEALRNSRFVMAGYQRCKYLAMSLYDLKVHGGPGPYELDGNEYDAVELYDAMMAKYTTVAPIPDTFAAASWFHPLMGYDAGYYGYIYSETFAADLFGEFEDLSLQNIEQSVVNNSLGKKYRDHILTPCATLDGDVMLRNFLGRESRKDAFLKRISCSVSR